jgi:phosphoglycolate phosphatase
MIQAALFDFDGTLADSFAAITASTNHVRTGYGLPPLPEVEVRKYVGYGLDRLMADLVPGAPVDAAVARYRAHHARVMVAETRLMPGVAETIPELARRGLRLGVCSNKRVEFTRELVRTLGLQPFFLEVLGPDDVNQRAKPDPAMLLEGLTRLKVSANEAVYVGDMIVDVQTARAAGVPVWLVSADETGGSTPVDGMGADRMLRSFAELLELLPPPVAGGGTPANGA